LNFRSEGRYLRRLHIIGGPGSGKSTLARQLGKRLDIPVYELDKIAFEGLAFTERPLDARLADVRRIAAQPTWITEGIFLGWTDKLLQTADVIVWLDHIRWHLAAWRIAVRFSQWGLEEAKRQPGARKFTRFRDYYRNTRQLIDVLLSSRAYYRASAIADTAATCRENRIATERRLMSFQEKVIHCRSATEIEMFLANLALTLPKAMYLDGEKVP
jgi:cytidylate kinase